MQVAPKRDSECARKISALSSKIQGQESDYEDPSAFQCLKCAEGCESCEDGSPCIVTLNWVLRTILLILQCVIIGCLPVVVLFTYKYKEIKVWNTWRFTTQFYLGLNDASKQAIKTLHFVKEVRISSKRRSPWYSYFAENYFIPHCMCTEMTASAQPSKWEISNLKYLHSPF